MSVKRPSAREDKRQRVDIQIQVESTSQPAVVELLVKAIGPSRKKKNMERKQLQRTRNSNRK